MALSVLGTLAVSVCHAGPPTLTLYTFESPPYQMSAEAGDVADVVGETIDTVNCAANRAGWSTNIRLAPQNRAAHSLSRNLIDGYFAIDPSTELDIMATRSDPVSLEKWYLFNTEPGPIPGTARIGVVDGSNEKAWLEAHGYNIFLSVSSPSQLPALLRRGRIDAALMDERTMSGLQHMESTGYNELNAHFLRYAPLYLYMSENFTANNPGFISNFNRHLPRCMEGQITLSPEEDERIRQLAERLFSKLDSMLDLQQAIDAGPRLETLADVLTFDSMWQAQAPKKATDLANRILELPGSRTLNAWTLTHPELITEALLSNNMGTLVAMSQLTSDYWQGDEPKFNAVVSNIRSGLTGLDAMYLSDIRYDASTSRFQVTVSAPVGPVNDNLPKGVISLGLDIEEALASSRPH